MTGAATTRRLGLRAADKLRTAAEFERARKGRGRHGDAFFQVQSASNGLDHPRLGMAIGTRTAASAVARNRLRRLIRESFRLHRELLPAVDLFVTARPAATAAGNRALFDSLRSLWQRIGSGR